MRMEGVLRFDYGASVPWVTLDDGGRRLRAVAGPDLIELRSPVPLEQRERRTCARFEVAEGETLRLRADARRRRTWACRGALDPKAALAETEAFWTQWAARCKCSGELAGRGAPLADHAEGAHLRADRRHRRRAHHLAAGADRRRAQLGLPLLLAARRHAHAARADERRLLRRGARLARLAAARGGRQPGADADHVRHRRRAAPAGVGAALARRATRARSRCASATPPRRSCSSTSTAR